MSLRWLFSDPYETFSAALAGACFVALTQIVTRQTLTPTLQVSVALFSVAIPFLVIFAVVPIPKGPAKTLLEKLTELLFIGSSIAALLGIACLFWFVRPLFGCAFAVSSIGAVSLLTFRSRRLKRLESAPTKVAKGDYPYGIPVPGKPHLVESPYSPGKYVDVEGFPPGTEVKDPYTDKIFLVP